MCCGDVGDMRWLAKTFTGLLLALALLSVGGYFAFSYVLSQLTKLPPKPTFPNDNPAIAKKMAQKATSKGASLPNKEADKPQEGLAETKSLETLKPKPLPTGAFEGTVSYSNGLVLRSGASRDSGTIGGLDFNEKVIVLETSTDGEWQKIRTVTEKEGWIRGGNIQKN